MLTKLTTGQLEFLGTRNHDRRLDLLVRPSHDATSGVALADFESIEACQAEDRYRAAALSEFDCSALASVPECEAGELAALLDSIADLNRIKPLSRVSRPHFTCAPVASEYLAPFST